MGQTPLRDRYPALFAITVEPEILIARAHQHDGWHIPFRRALGSQERIEWASLWREIADFSLTSDRDRIRWTLEPSGRFSVRSLYRKLCQGASRKHFSDIWRIAVPLKVRVFLWQLVRKRLPTRANIAHRHGPSTGACALCGEYEDSNHIFFMCPLAKFMWSAVRELLHCDWNPSCFADLYRMLNSTRAQTRRVLWICCAALCWSQWTTRNKFTLERTFPS